MSSRRPPRLGVNFKRLVPAVARFLLHRQLVGLGRLLTRCHAAMVVGIAKSQRMVHLSFSQLWDEVNSKFIWHTGKGHHRPRIGINQETIVQRGGVCLTLAGESLGQSKSHYEVWLVQPQEVSGTSAPALWPAVESACPASLRSTEAPWSN